ncbi:protein phosphatase 2C domain-containing protein [Desulfovibrio sp. JY]|nr:protein phosphatase 2C domain-containing protein [Desulfovibrio sp. JY]
MEVFAATDIGLTRKRNEDRYLVMHLQSGGLLAAVADGMGGEASGDKAAQVAVDILKQQSSLPEPIDVSLASVLKEADAAIVRLVVANPALEGMGATVTSAVVADGKVYWAHVGDSRLYLLRNNMLKQITTDHSFLQTFLDEGTMTPEQVAKHPFRNVLDQCVGCSECSPDHGIFEAIQGDCILLSSDGLHRYVPEKEILSILRLGDTSKKCVSMLIAAALKHGGNDNITALVVKM